MILDLDAFGCHDAGRMCLLSVAASTQRAVPAGEAPASSAAQAVTTHGCPTCTCAPPPEWSAPRQPKRPWSLPTAESAPRLFPAWAALEGVLAAGARSRADLVEAASVHVAAKTAANLLRNAELAGALASFRGDGGSLWYRLPGLGAQGGSAAPDPRGDGALSDAQVRSLPIGELESLGFDRLDAGQLDILLGGRLDELDEKQVERLSELLEIAEGSDA